MLKHREEPKALLDDKFIYSVVADTKENLEKELDKEKISEGSEAEVTDADGTLHIYKFKENNKSWIEI